jgi:hypothetical protein
MMYLLNRSSFVFLSDKYRHLVFNGLAGEKLYDATRIIRYFGVFQIPMLARNLLLFLNQRNLPSASQPVDQLLITKSWCLFYADVCSVYLVDS